VTEEEIIIPRCTMCGEPIPADHPRPNITLTCSDACRDRRDVWRKQRMGKKRCKYCLKPSTPAERSRFRRWRNAEMKNPPPDSELSPEELAEREYLRANPPQPRVRKPKVKPEEQDAEVAG
jgi:hypothetical protein